MPYTVWNSTVVLTQLETIWNDVVNVQEVVLGSPESYTHDVTVFIGLGSQSPRDAAGPATKRRPMRFINMIMIKVRGNESNAELLLAAILDDFQRKFFQNRTLGDNVRGGALDLSAADSPEYELSAGQEMRRYPIYVEVTQDEVIP